jgi:putative molybdopterin biosynthesis protein
MEYISMFARVVAILTEQDSALTTEEVANLLKVSKLTVYDLIKKGTLPSYRVGRQIRVEREALEQYKNKGNVKSEHKPTSGSGDKSTIIITGQDHCLDILGNQLEENYQGYRALRSQMGSLNGLTNMYQGKADIVSTHLFDAETGTYNIPYIRRLFVSHSFIVIHLLKRQAGLFVQKDNPKNITTWKQLNGTGISIVNRELGAGARVLLDEQLWLNHIVPSSIQGYQNIHTSHIDIANAVGNKEADVGIGAKHASKMMDIDFVPMIEENYDLVILKTAENQQLIDHVLSIIRQDSFKNTLKNLGFNVADSGKVLYEQ